MLEVRASLREVGDRVSERGPRAAEPGKLGEDVPDPVTLLPARSNLGERGGEARVRLVLRLDVAIQVQHREVAEPLNQQQANLYRQNERLRTARGGLLPRSMSGEIVV